MSARFLAYWENFRSSFWFAPTLMMAASMALAFAMVALDHNLPESWRSNGWAYSGGPQGARAVLSVIASSMITVAGVVFSITTVALTLASSQFGPRLMRTFMRDTSNQMVLGTFIATFLYCLLVLRTIRGQDDHEFVPQFSVSCGVLLGVISLGVLVYFIHHVAISIQVSYVLKTVSDDLLSAIDRLFPEQLGQGQLGQGQLQSTATGGTDKGPSGVSRSDSASLSVTAKHSGYLQSIDDGRLMEIASKHDVIIELTYRPGQFVVQDETIAQVYFQGRTDGELATKVSDTFIMGRERTSHQDVEFAVSQLIEVAVRALSPGINDPFTAEGCIDWLTVGLSRLVGRSLPDDHRADSKGSLRVIAHGATFPEVLQTAFGQLLEAARGQPAIMLKMLNSIEVIASRARRSEDLDSLHVQADLIYKMATTEIGENATTSKMEQAYAGALRILRDRN